MILVSARRNSCPTIMGCYVSLRTHSIAECAEVILENDKLRREIKLNAYKRGREFVWLEITKKYIKLFKKPQKDRLVSNR